MSPMFSLITLTTPDDPATLRWALAQENERVEVLLLQSQGEGGPGFSHCLTQALAMASGEWFVWLDPGVELASPHWVDDLIAAWQQADVDLLGVRGLTELTVHTLGEASRQEAVQVSRVIGGGRVTAGVATGLRHTQVLALGPGMIMGRTDRMRYNLQHYGAVFRSDGVLAFSLLSLLFAHMRLGVVEGLPVRERYLPADWARMSQLQRAVGFLPLDRPAMMCWRRNLEALLRTQPDVVTWLAQTSVETGWHRLETRRIGTLRLVSDRMDALVTDPPMETSGREPTWLLGVGAGHALDRALKHRHGRYHLVEPDAALLCHVLTRYDWSVALLEQRLSLHVLDTSHPVWQQVSARNILCQYRAAIEGASGQLRVRQGGSFYLNKSALLELERTLQRMWFRRQTLAALPAPVEPEFDVTVVSPRCAIFNELAQSFHGLGYRTRLLSVPDGSTPTHWASNRDWISALVSSPSRLTVFRNRSLLESDTWQEPVPASAPGPFPWVCWWWDVPNVASMLDFRVPSQQQPALGFARGLLPLLPPGSGWLPAAARPSMCCDTPLDGDWQHAVSFVGQSRWTSIRTQLAILRDLLTPHVPCGEHLTRRWQWTGSALELMDILSRDAEDAETAIASLATFSSAQSHFLEYVWKMALTGTFRLAAIELLHRRGIPVMVYGDDEWVQAGVVPPTSFGGPLGVHQLRDVYRRSRINLNLNFMQVSTTLNPKVLDIAACNGFVITDHRPELEDLFSEPANRVWSFDTLDALPDLVDRALQSDTLALAAGAGAWVRAHHTLDHRARWLAREYGLPPR